MVISPIERISPPRKLTSELSEILREQIVSGQLKPGDKLPTEQELIESAGVSRTVVREAIAALKAERLVISRQGVGVFVAKRLPEEPFLISTENLDRLDEFVQVLELRLGVEVEAAGLAARRRSAEDLEKMKAALADFERELAAGEPAAEPDIAFHHAIAAATGNPHYVNLIGYFARLLFVPGRRVFFSYTSLMPEDENLRPDIYLTRIRKEHDAIIAAIEEQSPERARDAMRGHLEQAKDEYHELADKLHSAGKNV